MTGHLARLAAALSAIWLNCGPATAFPPYRTTDAATSEPDIAEVRLGLIKLERRGGNTDAILPLLRLNLGLSHAVELLSEFEYRPARSRVEDGAVGLKWAPVAGPISVGVETLALLPVNRSQSGLGIESQLLATFHGGSVKLHINAGGFSDGRERGGRSGWRSSALGEIVRGRSRLGFEIFAKNGRGESTDARAGIGLIRSFGDFDVRAGLHVGLSAQAPDWAASLWISRSFALGG